MIAPSCLVKAAWTTSKPAASNLGRRLRARRAAIVASGARLLDWEEVAPFLEAARKLCRSEVEETGRARIHAVRAEGNEWVEAEEAYIGLSVADRDSGEEWLSETWWLSDIVIAENDREQAAQTVAALERSLAKIRRWLEEGEGPVGAEMNAGEAS